MRNRFTGAMVAATIAAAAAVLSLTVEPMFGQAQGRGAGAGRGQAAPARPARIGKAPNINGIYQAINTANWNLEDHPAQALSDFWQLGAIAAIPAGRSVVEGGTIPYQPAAALKKAENFAMRKTADPLAQCFMPGVPR